MVINMKNRLIFSVLSAVILITALTGCAAYDKIKNEIKSIFMFDENTEEAAPVPEEGKMSNTIAVGMYDFDTFNPLTTKSQTVHEAMEFIYEPLFTINDQILPEPQLAKDYGISADGKTITINLRDDVQWHDGTGFSAYDVAYTMKQIKNGETTYTENLKDMADYKVTGNYQLTVKFDHPISTSAALFTFPIVKSKTDMDSGKGYAPIGTGPFAYSGKISTDRYMLNAFDYYYGGRAKLDGVYIDECPDAEHYIYMYSSGAFDAATSTTVDLSTYTPKGSVVLNEYLSNNLIFIGINNAVSQFKGANTRIAMSELIDREGIVSSVLYSRAVAVDIPVNPRFKFYSGKTDDFSINEHLVLEHIKNDGWTDDGGVYAKYVNGQYRMLAADILVNKDNAEKKAIAEKISNDFAKYGIKTYVSALPYEQYIERINAGQYDLFIGEYSLPITQDNSDFIGGRNNLFNYKNNIMDALMTQIGMTSNEEELKSLYDLFMQSFKAEAPIIPIAYAKEYMLSSPVLKDIQAPGVSGCYKNSSIWKIK